MSTANFNSVNASKIFMVRCEDEQDYEMAEENIFHELKKKGWYAYEGKTYDRTYLGKIFARKDVDIYIGCSYTSVGLNAVIRSGYYADANLDWEIEINDKRYDYGEFSEDDSKDCLEDYFCVGFSKMQAKNLLKKINRTIDEMVDELESVYENCSEPLVCMGVFGNGEAIYMPADNPLGIRPSLKTM